MSLNKVIMQGRLTADPELKQTPNGILVTSFSLALNKGEGKADFFNIVAWRHTAEFVCKYFKKGDGIIITGHLSSRSYEKDNVKHTVYEVVCDEAGFVDSRRSETGNTSVPQTANAPQIANNALPDGGMEYVEGDDDLPF